MTLKELRISKGLSQSDCAKYLGMSIRNYQNYEYDENKINTIKYNIIYKKLEEYGREFSLQINGNLNNKMYNTHVVTGKALVAMSNSVKKFQRRDCYNILEKYVNEDFVSKICILYGLRRTGKTTLLFQMIGELPVAETAYIKIQTTDNMKNLVQDLDFLFYNGYKFVFIDEITLMEDFINASAILADLFAAMGMKIFVSGTDSLGFTRAIRDELYDRNIMVHTSYIPFREYSRLLNVNSIDKYIEYGGTLKAENMSFDDPDSSIDDVAFRDDESTRKYIDTAISKNIQRTLKNDCHGEYFNELRELYDKGELTNIINRVVANINHNFLLSVITDKFKSFDLGSTKELLLHDYPLKRSTVLYEINEAEVIERLKNIIDVKEKNETLITVTNEHMDKVKSYLEKLDLIVSCKERYEGSTQKEIHIITQPGMRYSITKALVYSLLQDVYFKNVPEYDKNYIIEKILNDVKGKMLEDIVLLETFKFISNDFDVFKYKFTHGGEFDMVIYDKINNTCKIYEIKHSLKIHERQTRYLKDNEKCAIIEKRFGKITGKYVIYRGEDKIIDDIQYLNVEKFLCK